MLLAISLAAAAAASPAPSIAMKDRIICRGITRTGTRVEQRVCLTAREWEIIDEHAMELVREVQRKPLLNR